MVDDLWFMTLSTISRRQKQKAWLLYNHQLSTINYQPSTINHQPSTNE
ncbi:MAG: hypothetical protein DSM107014_03485 [Gomphosphaeria aponina SAG 52.96 = DSM 107014]|uniref:Uncharacterized protein n=1 Tax=Gomphosphaeria aponina SAG 52.96 = DSM 107014 TaxID=1521640 RepID=A0A941JRI1_9CHRO|nr:hypothetical protein [Gomphosphaeria aponina SAG 52.96 = DSM 107014]